MRTIGLEYLKGSADFTRGLEVVGVTVKLSVLHFKNYLKSNVCVSDAIDCAMNSVLQLVTQHGNTSFVLRATFYLFLEKMLYRFVETSMLATLLQSHIEFLRDAGKHHLSFLHVQNYFFEQNSVRRFFRAAGRFLFPNYLYQYFDVSKIFPSRSPVIPTEAPPPDPAASLRFFSDSYQQSVPRAVLLSGVVCDATRLILQQLQCVAALCASRGEPTSYSRVFKPYLCDLAGQAVATVVLYAARVAGATCGLALSRGGFSSLSSSSSSSSSSSFSTGGCVFWGERLAVLAAVPLARALTLRLCHALAARLEALCPATAEDDCADDMEREAAEEANGFAAQWVPPRENLYDIIGVEEKASQEEIRRAYRKAALENHPDRVGMDEALQKKARERMTALNYAYETLNSETKRRQYDASRTESIVSTTLDRLEKLSPVTVLTGGLTWLALSSVAAGTLLYTHYVTAFFHLTTPGTEPLDFFSG